MHNPKMYLNLLIKHIMPKYLTMEIYFVMNNILIFLYVGVIFGVKRVGKPLINFFLEYSRCIIK